jgi:hypothetical protein
MKAALIIFFQKIGYMADFEEFNPHLNSSKRAGPAPWHAIFPPKKNPATADRSCNFRAALRTG